MAKERSVQNRFLFEGATLLAEALASNLILDEVFVTADAYAEHSALRRLPDEQVYIVESTALAKLSDVESPTGIVATAIRPSYDREHLLAGNIGVALLAGLQDPGNVGTLIRSAEAFGLGGILILAGTADPFQPKVLRAAMGSAFRLPLCNIAADELGTKLFGRPLIVAARGGDALPTVTFPPRAILAIGHERHGYAASLPPPAMTIEIPHQGPTESLNAAVAGSILFYTFSCKLSCQDLGQ
jgi:TrmH family RNA methyltransferase